MDNRTPYCIDGFKVDEVRSFGQLKNNNSNKIINVIDSWNPPYILVNEEKICGPFPNIIQLLSKHFGYK